MSVRRLVPSEAAVYRALMLDAYTLHDLATTHLPYALSEYDEGDGSSVVVVGLSGEVLVDGLDNLDEFTEHTTIALPEGPYETVAGYIMATLGRLPNVGDKVSAPGAELEVMELDGRRASRIRVVPMHVVDHDGELSE